MSTCYWIVSPSYNFRGVQSYTLPSEQQLKLEDIAVSAKIKIDVLTHLLLCC